MLTKRIPTQAQTVKLATEVLRMLKKASVAKLQRNSDALHERIFAASESWSQAASQSQWNSIYEYISTADSLLDDLESLYEVLRDLHRGLSRIERVRERAEIAAVLVERKLAKRAK